MMEHEVSVPLAPRTTFPAIGEPNVLYFFTDAAREDGTGFGGHATVQWEGDVRQIPPSATHLSFSSVQPV